MKPRARHPATPMSPDAYAGFLKLWLTPAGRLPKASAELDAYLRHAERTDPLPEAARRAIGRPVRQAA